jgi:hypothetical protein
LETEAMKEKLTECRDICHEIMCDLNGDYPIGVVRIGRLVEEMLAEWQEWDDDDVAALPYCFPDEDSFPAA